jgi:hypothetical protein
MSKCPSKKQDVVIDYLSEMVIEKMPCDQGGAGKKKRKSKSKKQRGDVKQRGQRGGVTRLQVKTFLKRVMNIGITCLVIFCIVTGPWENLVQELQDGYELWTSGGCHSMGQRFFNAFSAGNRFCSVATGLERDAWNFLMNDPTGRSTLFGIVSSVMGVAGAYASYHSLANRIADGVARVVGSVPEIQAAVDADTQRQIDALAGDIQRQVDTAVNNAIEGVLANPQMYARIVGMMGSGSAAASGMASSYTVPDEQDSQETLGSDPDNMMGGKRRKTKKRKNKSRKQRGKSKKRNRK